MKSTGAEDLTKYKSILRKTETSLSFSPIRRRHVRMNSSASSRSLKNVSFYDTVSQDGRGTRKVKVPLPLSLPKFEQKEMASYKRIYYCPKQRFLPEANPYLENNGFSQVGVYQALKHDQIAYRYEVLNLIERTAFSQVFQVFDHKQKEIVALKIINNVNQLFKSSEKEAKILFSLNKSQIHGVVKLFDSFVFRNHRFLVFELLQTTLLVKINESRSRGLPLEEVKRVASRVLGTLKQIHQKGIIHNDLKPEDIMFKDEEVKIIDFGAASYVKKALSSDEQNKFYQSPEVILGSSYSTSSDLWSFGCVLVEMLIGLPPFRGEDQHQQLLSIMEYRGYPHKELIVNSDRAKEHFYSVDKVILKADSKGKHKLPGSKNIRNLLPNVMGLGELVEGCLEMNPNKRITAAAAMKSSFFTKNTPVITGFLKPRRQVRSFSNNLPE